MLLLNRVVKTVQPSMYRIGELQVSTVCTRCVAELTFVKDELHLVSFLLAIFFLVLHTPSASIPLVSQVSRITLVPSKENMPQ